MQNCAIIAIFAFDFRSYFVQRISQSFAVMKPTFRPVVYAHHKRKDGTYNVKINVYFNGKERRLPTTIYCTKEDLTRTYHLKQGDAYSKATQEILKMQKAVSELSFFEVEGKDVDWLVAKIKAKLSAASFHLDFLQFAEEYISGMKPATKKAYSSAINALRTYVGGQIDINDITKKKMQDFVSWVDARKKISYNRKTGEVKESNKDKKKGNTSARYIGLLSTIYKAAKIKYNDEDEGIVLIPRSPFDNVVVQQEAVDGQSALPMEIIQRLILSNNVSGRGNIRFALDVMIVSFGFMGANMTDLYHAVLPKDKLWVYNRQKTKDRRSDNAEVRVELPECLKPYMERLGAGTSKTKMLPLLSKGMSEKTMTAKVNRNIKTWCEREGIPPFTTYALRKSWATLGRRFEDKAIVDEAIAHTGGSRMLDIYAEKPWDRYQELNKKVLALFEWSKE